MTTLFDKKERSPLSLIVYNILLIAFVSLNNNRKIQEIPYAHISLGLIHIIFSIYLIFKAIILIKNTLKTRPKMSLIELIQVVFVGLFTILLLFITVESIVNTVSYIDKTF